MKGTEKKALGRSILNTSISFLKGIAAGANPIVGAVVGAGEGVVKSIQKEKEKNLNSEVGGVGKVDYSHLLGAGVFILLVIALFAGWIDIEQLKELIGIFNKTQ